MSINRYNPQRDANEKAIVKTLKQLGVSIQRINGSGVPDILAGYKGETFLLEIKTKKGKLTPAQVKFHESWRGKNPVVVHTIDEALKVFGI